MGHSRRTVLHNARRLMHRARGLRCVVHEAPAPTPTHPLRLPLPPPRDDRRIRAHESSRVLSRTSRVHVQPHILLSTLRTKLQSVFH